MRVRTRQQMKDEPEGTIYAEGVEWVFSGLFIKGEPVIIHGENRGWWALDMAWPGVDGDPIDALRSGESFPAEDYYTRDADFDDSDEANAEKRYMVFEREDLMALRGYIDNALKVA